MRTIGIAVIALAALLSPAAAENPLFDFSTNTAADQAPIDPVNATELPITITFDCGLLLANPTTGSATFTAEASPNANLTLAVAPVSVSAADCAPSGGGAGQTVDKTGALVVTPTATTPAVQPITIYLNGTFGTQENAMATSAESFSVTLPYKPCFALSIANNTSIQVSTTPHNFTLTQEYCSNAYSMIMFEEVRLERGTLKGLEMLTRQPPATAVQDLSFTPPTDRWETSNLTFVTYVHYIDPVTGTGGDPMLTQHYRWTFVNDGAPRGNGGNGGGGKDSPAIGVPIAVALLALAFAARRRVA